MLKTNLDRARELEEACCGLLNSTRHMFGSLKDLDVPEAAGVYVISAMKDGADVNDDPDADEAVWYVGQANNLRRRICRNHLNGSENNSRFKKYLMADGQAGDRMAARDFICRKCFVRWLEVVDGGDPTAARKRSGLESYLTALLDPRYGISLEKADGTGEARMKEQVDNQRI